MLSLGSATAATAVPRVLRTAIRQKLQQQEQPATQWDVAAAALEYGESTPIKVD